MTAAAVLLWFSYYRWRPWGSERLSDLPQVTEPASDEAQINSQVKQLQRLCFPVAPRTSISVSVTSNHSVLHGQMVSEDASQSMSSHSSDVLPGSFVATSWSPSSVQLSCSVVSDSLWSPGSTPDLPVHHQLLEPAQPHVHWVGDAIQPSHLLSSPSPPAFNLS